MHTYLSHYIHIGSTNMVNYCTESVKIDAVIRHCGWFGPNLLELDLLAINRVLRSWALKIGKEYRIKLILPKYVNWN